MRRVRYFALRAQHSVADMREGAPSACILEDDAEKMEESDLLIPPEIHVPVSGTTLLLTDYHYVSIHDSKTHLNMKLSKLLCLHLMNHWYVDITIIQIKKV